jgi:hypothetical protein
MTTSMRPADSSAPKLTRDQAADLLQRYPHVSDAEVKLILTFLRKGRHLDVGMITGDDALKPQLDRFMADHAKHFRLGFFEGTRVVAAMAAFLGLCWLVWETVKPAALTA